MKRARTPDRDRGVATAIVPRAVEVVTLAHRAASSGSSVLSSPTLSPRSTSSRYSPEPIAEVDGTVEEEAKLLADIGLGRDDVDDLDEALNNFF